MENSKIVEPPKIDVLDNFEKLINCEKHSDFMFVCSDGIKVHVQASIIAAQCEAFATMIESGLSESKSKCAFVKDVDSETMLELIRYLYCRRVNNIEEIQGSLVIAANKYGLTDLKEFCVSNLMTSLTIDNVDEIYEIADLLDEELLKTNCIDFINV